MSTRLINLESKQNELDGKFFDMLDTTHARQTLVDIKTMFLELLGKLKDQANPPSELKSTCDEAQTNLHVVMLKDKITMHDTNLLDNESAHFLFKGNTTLLGCASGFGSSKPHIATTPSKKLGTKSTTPI